MNMHSNAVMAPPPPRTIEEMRLPLVMMRDILIKTIFRKNTNSVSDLAKAVHLPVQVTQELVDLARDQRLLEATGTLNANSSNEMGYQLTDSRQGARLGCIGAIRIFRGDACSLGRLP